MEEVDLAVDRLGRMAATRPICEDERRLLEAARDCLASYASAAHDLAEAGVATPRLLALIERGWREALAAFNRAEEERAAGALKATG
jgi:RNA polymerase-interacting CarD/CdnL/TRCF family regulator